MNIDHIPEPQRLLADLILLEHDDPGGREAGMSTNAYVLPAEGEALLVDAAFDYRSAPSPRQATRHLAGNGDLFEAFKEEFDVPIFLHPLDAGHPQARSAGVRFSNPMESAMLAKFGVETIHFPSQTDGSVMVYRQRDGLLLSGDSAMGATRPQAAEGMERLIRPPVFTSVDDSGLRRNWPGFERTVPHFVPLHGSIYVDRGGEMEEKEIMRPLVREEPTRGVEG